MVSIFYKAPHHSGKLRMEVYKESCREQALKYYATHKEERLEYHRQYRQKHREELNAKARLRYANNIDVRERKKQRNKRWYERKKAVIKDG